MTKPNSGFRQVLSFTTSLSMALPLIPAAAQAQDAGTPPSRVGQIAYVDGSVSFNGSGSGGWAAAAVNYPVSTGDTLYTQDGAQAAIALNASKISLNSDTELQITQLDNQNFAATQSQGEAFFAINDLQPGQTFTITTPRGNVAINQNGEYDVIAGDANNPTVATAFQGSLTVTAPGSSLQVAQGQDAVLSGTSQTQAQLAQASPDDFARRQLAANAPPPPSYAPPVVTQMTGAYELSNYGSWDQNPQYGAVWYPQVDAGWAPYREGHWAFIAPWGWTWVENEPWGFAPFHYGRWFQDGGRWGWAPAPAYEEGGYGADYQPVYAPAVVSFFGLAVGVGITAALLSSRSVGWVPLGPNEPYYPSYRASPDYIRRINAVNVRNINNIDVHNTNYYGSTVSYDHLANRSGATFAPGSALSHGDQISRVGRPAPENMLAAARPFNNEAAGHTAGQPDYRLPTAAAPLAHERPGVAPHPTAFAQRTTVPPAVISHGPIENGANGGARTQFGAPAGLNHPTFSGTNPGYHPPPPPPSSGQHLGTLPPAQGFHPQTESRPEQTQAFHPQETTRPQENQAFHPQTTTRPTESQAFHPQVQQERPQTTQAYHPQEIARPQQTQAFHPQVEQRPAEQARPMQQSRPAPHVEAPHPAPEQHQDKQKP